ncbi:hypothetical protein [Neorhizobium tomejilense]|uniref:hypothetical protein n=1 Tax=Neorhizobium tomejilense TaxID=2093828 RepID=UPI003ECFE9EF
MAHVRKQMRDAVIARLKSEFGDEFVGDAVRLMRSFTKSDLPFVAVVVSDTVAPTDNNPPGCRVDNRGFIIAIRACVHEDDEDALDVLDVIGTRIETSLVDGSVLGVGRLLNWRLGGTVGPEPQPVSDGTLIASTTTFTAGMFTLDADPETNLHS